MKYVLALDQGTTSSRAIVFNQKGEAVGEAHRDFPQIYPQAGWVEHNPEDIFFTQLQTAIQAVKNAGLSPTDIRTVGITNQRETTVVWEKSTGKPVYNAIVWQCRRTAEMCENMREKYAETVYNKTGLVIDAYFSATKIKWILDNVEGARQKAENGELLFGTVDTYLLWKITGGKVHATDYTNASRTMLFNIHTLTWDSDLLSLFGVPLLMLPSVYPSSHNFGTTSPEVFGEITANVCGVAGDQQSALFGHLAVNAGDVKNTYGTGCFLLMNTGKTAVKSKNGLVTTLSACLDGAKPDYVLEGSVFIGGAVTTWLCNELQLVSHPAETETLATAVNTTNGVYVVPAFTGLGAPYWDADARGTITGITRGTTKNHIVRACLESIAYQVNDVVQAMQKDSSVQINSLSVDGGATKNNFLMQFQANILGCQVSRSASSEITALGVAYLAGICNGIWRDTAELKTLCHTDKVFSPAINCNTRQILLDGWQKALRQTLTK